MSTRNNDVMVYLRNGNITEAPNEYGLNCQLKIPFEDLKGKTMENS